MNHCFFPTPDSIVTLFLQKEVPGYYSNVLEPSVGDGALLRAIAGRYKTLTVLDVSADNIDKAKLILKGDNINYICKDFLTFKPNGAFDLILANPPFKNRLQDFIIYNQRKVPIELAFVMKCLEHLAEEGRAVFILPSSIISGDKTKWLRRYIAENFSISSIYKLKRFAFKKVEGSFYILSLTKSNKKECDINLFPLAGGTRQITQESLADFGHDFDPDSIINREIYRSFLKIIGSIPLQSLAELSRGSVCATNNKQFVYHSTDFKSVVAPLKKLVVGAQSSANLEQFDLVVKRVGRRPAQSLAMFLGANNSPCSDCLIKIKSRSPGSLAASYLLLTLRVSISLGAQFEFELSGSGANYISMTKLKDLNLIDIIRFTDKSIIESYAKALHDHNISAALAIEETVSSLANQLHQVQILANDRSSIALPTSCRNTHCLMSAPGI